MRNLSFFFSLVFLNIFFSSREIDLSLSLSTVTYEIFGQKHKHEVLVSMFRFSEQILPSSMFLK